MGFCMFISLLQALRKTVETIRHIGKGKITPQGSDMLDNMGQSLHISNGIVETDPKKDEAGKAKGKGGGSKVKAHMSADIQLIAQGTHIFKCCVAHFDGKVL